ncbi:histidine phosphatase family protein [Nigerium massiliense]|uniref:histidine phosphatase family protein n=1 Tax=Nigerium massiliense TaxID=1522317 RepID=UPI000590EB77|nr:histidine phosphatase family protein [Nigerium massiliense]
MRLHLVRHGRTPSNVTSALDTAYPGADLDDRGRAQAELLVERFDGVPLEGLYASDLVRTQQTIAPLAAARGLDVGILGGLREIQAGEDEMSHDFGRYVGVLQRWVSGELTARVPGGEDAIGFYERYDDAVAQIAAAGHEHALLVTHGAALRMWVGARAEGLSPDQAAKGVLGNTAHLVLDGEPGDWRFVSWDSGEDVPGPDGDPLEEQARQRD